MKKQSSNAFKRALRIGHRSRKNKFDWHTTEQVLEKLKEEVAELEEALASGLKKEILSELGDVFFAAVQVARHENILPEKALAHTNQKFEKRYQMMRDLCQKKGLYWNRLNLKQKDRLWQEVKKQLASNKKK